MKEIYELRVLERHAGRLFEKDEGKRLGDSVRLIFIESTDPRCEQIGLLQKKLRDRKGLFFDRSDLFFAGWDIVRKYTKAEIENAEFFHFCYMPEFEPSAEECGTVYDESTACSVCGVGATQTTPLRLKNSSIPKSKDFCYTIADNEFLISRRAVEVFNAAGVTGVEYAQICTSRNFSEMSKDWFQLRVPQASLEISAETEFGLKLFEPDEKGEFLCPYGHKAGLNMLSELHVVRRSLNGNDFQATRQFKGLRQGLLRPIPIFMVSKKVRNLVESHKLKGVRMDVAYARLSSPT